MNDNQFLLLLMGIQGGLMAFNTYMGGPLAMVSNIIIFVLTTWMVLGHLKTVKFKAKIEVIDEINERISGGLP
jgi:hypothetical protein